MNSLIAFDLDASSSMNADSTVQAFNAFLTLMQYRQDDCALYLATFDDVYTELVKFESVFSVPRMSYNTGNGQYDTELQYRPTGATLLFDSVAMMVRKVREHIATLPIDERPQSVTLVVQTDGGNNRGRVESSEVARIVRSVQAEGWNVLFLADAVGIDNEQLKRMREQGRDAGSAVSAKACGFNDDQIIVYNDPEKGFEDAAEAILESIITGKINLKKEV